MDGEIQVLRLYEEIIRQHPQFTSDQVDEELVKQVYTPKRQARLEGAFRWAQNRITRFIERQSTQVFSTEQKKVLKDRVNRILFQLPPPASVYADEPDLFTKTDIYYERVLDGTLRLRVGGAYLYTVKSWFNMVFTFAHEIAHAIDPCEMKSIQTNFTAYDRLTSCFIQNQIMPARKPGQECGESDQLSETFADWMAAQVVGEALTKFATEFDRTQLLHSVINSVRDLCEQDESLRESDNTVHPSPEIRIEKIFGQSPVVRKVLGCDPAVPEPSAQKTDHGSYCNLEPMQLEKGKTAP